MVSSYPHNGALHQKRALTAYEKSSATAAAMYAIMKKPKPMTYGLALRIIPSLLSFYFAGFSFALEEATMTPMRFNGPQKPSTNRG